ncbi:hypothetical protein PG991_000367 [Apiospora marii]|uniref:Uncharacterized protein n=1 Tax=Apiospora marii TaxID=335849 RepID=A0ABR1T3V7_9PEZI
MHRETLTTDVGNLKTQLAQTSSDVLRVEAKLEGNVHSEERPGLNALKVISKAHTNHVKEIKNDIKEMKAKAASQEETIEQQQ